MGRSRYPRRGHRLAPATLKELLEVPVPGRYTSGTDSPTLLLSDLDESAWERFGDDVCGSLAREVIRTVGNSARGPMSLADRRLPALPAGMKLADLPLEVRTFNCLASIGVHRRAGDLRAMTIEAVLGIPGFWAKCLVDLLTSLEYVIDHPKARKRLRAKAATLAARPRVRSRWPRPGYRVVPQTLREILDEPIPSHHIASPAVRGLKLCDLNEDVWKRLSSDEVSVLTKIIVARVSVSGHNRVVRQRRLPKLPKGTRLEDLMLENRTYNCLRQEKFHQRPQDLSRRTVGEMLSIKAFGAKCLVDLLTSMETVAAREGNLDEKLTAQAEALGKIPEARDVHFSDARLGPVLQAVETDAATVGEFVERVLRRRADPGDPARFLGQLRRLRDGIEAATRLTLEEELIQIIPPADCDRDRRIVAEYYGWAGGGKHTLEQLGKKFGLSRERIRQVCVRAIKRHRGTEVFAPVLDRTLAFIAPRLPAVAEELDAELISAGLSTCGLPLETVQEAAEFLSRDAGFVVVKVDGHRLAVRADMAAVPQVIAQTARRSVLSYGVGTIGEVASEVASRLSTRVDRTLVRTTLAVLDDFQWLDRSRGWFQLESVPQYGLRNMIEKVLSVVGSIEVSKLRSAVARYRRSGRNAPPSGVLLEFCRRIPDVRVEGNMVIAEKPRDWRETLADIEAGMVRVLKEHGPVMERGQLEERCLEGGMNRFSFNAIVMCSPVIVQYGRSVYGLLGSKPSPKTVRALGARKPASAANRVLRDYGRTADGTIYLAYRLSKASISGGVITVPPAIRELISGKFVIRTPDGRAAGLLVSKKGCAWGLGPVLRRQRAEPGDHLLILLDTTEREAFFRLGDADVLEAVTRDELAVT